MYDFHTLSPVDFEELVRDLLQAELGVRFESFGPGPDGGIDLRLATDEAGIIVQAKHHFRGGRNQLLRELVGEDLKVARLSPRPRRYILATSVSTSPALKRKIIATMPNAPLVPGDIFGLKDLNNLLGRHPTIQQQHFKLWLTSMPVLERILKSGIHNRTQTELKEIQEMVPRFVQNRSVAEAEEMLAQSGSLIIAGDPGVGKSTLARKLTWLHAAQGWRIFVVDDIKEAFDVANEGENRLIFFDDFLGQIRLTPDFTRGIDQRLLPLLQRVSRNKNLRFILTTRDYILSQAQLLGGRLADADLASKRYVLNVGAYTREARARIVYNHIYFSGLPAEDRAALLSDDFYLRIIDHPNFNPRLIEVLTSAGYAAVADEPIVDAVERILKNPRALWERPYRHHLSDEGRALMLALLFNERSVPLDRLRESFARMARALELDMRKAEREQRFNSALKELEGSVIAIANREARFSNPGVRDFLEGAVIEDRQLPLIVAQLATRHEFEQCWSIWISGDALPSRTDASRRVWLDALERVAGSDGVQPWKILEMAIGLYDFFQDDGTLERVVQARDSFSTTNFSPSHARQASQLLENLHSNLLPLRQLDALITIVTEKAAELLAEYGYALSIDELEELDRALHDFGNDTVLSDQATRKALAGVARNLDEHLGDLTSLEDLDVFDEELKAIMDRRSIQDTTMMGRIDSKRRQLEQQEEEDQDSEGVVYTPFIRTVAASPISTEEIRSMFNGLQASIPGD